MVSGGHSGMSSGEESVGNGQDTKPLSCTFILPNGNRCCLDQQGERGLCFWHDPTTDKREPGLGQKLAALLEQGVRGDGFELAGMDLEYVKMPGVHLVRANLSGARLFNANLEGAHLFGANLADATLFKTRLSFANLRTANLRDANLLGAVLTGAKLEGVELGPGDIILNERKARACVRNHDSVGARRYWQEAEEIYLALEKNFKDAGRSEAGGDMYYRHMVARRKLLRRDSLHHWVSLFMDLLCGYGERPIRIIGAWLVLILFSSVFFFFFGIAGIEEVLARVEGAELPVQHTIPIGYRPEAGMLKNVHDYALCVYFSVITMTTTGYGDLIPTEATRAMAAVEAFLGTFLSAVFVMVFGRKMMRG